jgi:undecaprenyl pyrophosphate phosphatase UppP
MGSVGVLPKELAKVQPRFRTPSNAVHLQIGLSVVPTIAVGLWVGSAAIYGFLDDIITVYVRPGAALLFDPLPYLVVAWMIIGAVVMWWIERRKPASMIAMDDAFKTMDADFDPTVL